MIQGWQYCSNPMTGSGQTIMNTDVSVRFKLFGVLAILGPSGMLRDIIFRAFGVPGGVFWWFGRGLGAG